MRGGETPFLFGITYLCASAPHATLTVRTINMSGIAASLQHLRDKNRGFGTNSQALKYLNQDYEALRARCFESGSLFQDDTFPALPSSLGFKELGPASYKTRGVSWKRPTVSGGSPGECMCVFGRGWGVLFTRCRRTDQSLQLDIDCQTVGRELL